MSTTGKALKETNSSLGLKGGGISFRALKGSGSVLGILGLAFRIVRPKHPTDGIGSEARRSRKPLLHASMSEFTSLPPSHPAVDFAGVELVQSIHGMAVEG